MPLSAAVLLVTTDGRVVGITRGEDKADINLPGGMLEQRDGSSLYSAAYRELMEETGIDALDLHPVMTARSGVSRPTLCTTFMPVGAIVWPEQLRSDPFEGHPGIFAPQELLQQTCSFRHYNQRLFAMMGLV